MKLRFNDRAAGLTLLELATAVGVLGGFLGAALVALVGVQGTFAESQLVDRLGRRMQLAAERLTELTRRAVTIDADFQRLQPAGGRWHGLAFRTLAAVDAAGAVSYDADTVFVLGPDDGAHPNAGIIIGRGADLDAVYVQGRGADGVLGTMDDVATAAPDGPSTLELLVPDTFAPQVGEMLSIDVSPSNRLITMTLRGNARRRDGAFVLDTDLVLTARVALRQ